MSSTVKGTPVHFHDTLSFRDIAKLVDDRQRRAFLCTGIVLVSF